MARKGFVNPVLFDGEKQILVNPGSWAVYGATRKDAKKNMEQLLKDAEIDGLKFKKLYHEDYCSDGRLGYLLYKKYKNGREKSCIIDMPGLPVKMVRYTGEKGQRISMFPRLYVDGSSYVWKFIVEILQEEFNPKKSAN